MRGKDKLLEYVKKNWMTFTGIGALLVVLFYGIYEVMGFQPMFMVTQFSVLGGASGMALDSLLLVAVAGVIILCYGLYRNEEKSEGFLYMGMYLAIGAVLGWIVLSLLINAVNNIIVWLANPLVTALVLVVLLWFIWTRGIIQAIDKRTKVKR